MGKSIKKVKPKKRGRPATGKDPILGARVPKELIREIDTWADRQDAKRSEAVRRLIEMGLAASALVKGSAK
jgi:hypothetical protein